MADNLLYSPALAEKGELSPVEESKLSPNSSTVALSPDWSTDEEKALVRRLDLIVMPLLILGFFALQFDRGNIGNALTDFFFQDVGITQSQFNIGQQLLSLGIVLLELPSNLILYRVGPSIWISAQIFVWGLVATFQAFQKGSGAFFATRLLLGLCESGFIPAGLFTITLWYKKEETSKRFACFFIGNMAAQALSGIVSYGILHMRGVAGLTGWQWLFIIEGLFTIVVAFIFATLFPGQPGKPKSLLGINYFSERELHILRRRLLHDDPGERTANHITLKEIAHTLSDWRIYPHLIMTISALSPTSVLWSYGPLVINSFGYGRLESNALVSVGGWILVVVNVFFGWVADRTRLRGPVVVTGLLIWWGIAIGNLILTESTSKTARYALLTLAISFSSSVHATNGSWLAINGRSPADRSLRMALFIMAANCSGIVGSQLFQANDAPNYHTGWTIIVCLVSFGLLLISGNLFLYWLANKKIDAENAEGTDGSEKRKKYFL